MTEAEEYQVLAKVNKEILNHYRVPLADVRMLIVDLMKDGITEIPLGEFLLLLKEMLKRIETES